MAMQRSGRCLQAPGEVQKMIIRPSVLGAGLMLLLSSTVLQAHQIAGGTHQHVWRPTTYGQDYRPGHSVHEPTGSITIWSPATLNEYGAGNRVSFIRPSPQNKLLAPQSSKQVQHRSNTPLFDIPHSNAPRANRSRSNIPQIKSLAPSRYGKDHRRGYGK